MMEQFCNKFQKKYIPKFKSEYTFEQRCAEFKKVIEKYPEKIPIILEKDKSNGKLEELTKYKSLASNDLKVGQLILFIREQIKLNETFALFMTFNGRSYNHNTYIRDIYEYEKDTDGFLYAIYSSENVFGYG